MKKLITFVLVICLICVGFAGCTKTEYSQVKYVLYCGLKDVDTGTQILTLDEAQETARKIITDKGLGYTEYVTHGASAGNESAKDSNTLVYVLFFTEEADVKAVANEIKEKLNISSILIEKSLGNHGFSD